MPPQPTRSAAAFAPANISLIFETYDAEPPRERGSLGVGITLDKGVTARVSFSDKERAEILVRGESWEFPTVRAVAAELSPDRPLRVEIDAAFPFGCGFGMSGASALATALAAEALLNTGRSRGELGLVAHLAEVNHSTGLGDVGGQFNGGIMIKTKKFQPLSVERLPVAPRTLHWRIFGPIMTSSVIGSREKLLSINAAGRAALRSVREAGASLTLEELFRVSKKFAEDSGLLRSEAVRRSIAEAEEAGHAATMIMLGEAVVATGPFPGSRPAEILPQGARPLDG